MDPRLAALLAFVTALDAEMRKTGTTGRRTLDILWRRGQLQLAEEQARKRIDLDRSGPDVQT